MSALIGRSVQSPAVIALRTLLALSPVAAAMIIGGVVFDSPWPNNLPPTPEARRQFAGVLGPLFLSGVILPIGLSACTFLRRRWSALIALDGVALLINAVVLWPWMSLAIFYSHPGAC